jgi:hypothetical protein
MKREARGARSGKRPSYFTGQLSTFSLCSVRFQLGTAHPRERIEPAQALEAHEIGVPSVQHRIVLEGESRHLSIAHQIPGGAQRFQKFKNLFDMPGTSLNQSGMIMPSPRAGCFGARRSLPGRRPVC